MRGTFSIVTIISCFLLFEPVVLADPPDGAHGAAAPAEQRTRAAQLTTRAIATARAGDCPAAFELGLKVRDLDPAYHDQAFARDPAIRACIGTRPSPDPPSAGFEGRSVVFGAGLALGKQGIALLELRLGWMFRPQLGVFATVLNGASLEGGGGYQLLGLGARAGIEVVFVDLRIGQMNLTSGCDFDEPCITRHRVGWSAGVGLELVHLPRFGLELRGDILGLGLGATRETLFLVGLGFSFYP